MHTKHDSQASLKCIIQTKLCCFMQIHQSCCQFAYISLIRAFLSSLSLDAAASAWWLWHWVIRLTHTHTIVIVISQVWLTPTSLTSIWAGSNSTVAQIFFKNCFLRLDCEKVLIVYTNNLINFLSGLTGFDSQIFWKTCCQQWCLCQTIMSMVRNSSW